MKKILSIFLIACLVLGIGFFRKADSKEASPVMRVAVLKDADQFVLSVRGSYEIVHPVNNALIKEGKRLKRSRVVATRSEIHIGKRAYPLKQLTIIAKKDISIKTKGRSRRYRGKIEIIRDSKNKLLVINSLNLEDYIKGVLYHEITDRWPMEAMKAQAIAARSYALYQRSVNKDKLYDVTSDIYSQVYGGRSAERYRTNLAVERTTGKVLMHNNKILPAYFHSNSGGHTEDAGELWNHDLSPLKGVVDEYAQHGPLFNWKKNFRLKDIQEKLNKNGYKIDLIKDISVVDRNRSGRVKKMKITDRAGKKIYLSGSKFRKIVGPNLVRSNKFDVIMKGYYFDLVGNGWGHGVGMCQWGAYFMAKERINHRDILKYYYPGIKIRSFKG